MGGRSANMKKKRGGHLQRASLGFDRAWTELSFVIAGHSFLPIIFSMMGGFYLGYAVEATVFVCLWLSALLSSALEKETTLTRGPVRQPTHQLGAGKLHHSHCGQRT